jgi:hypothetical protein
VGAGSGQQLTETGAVVMPGAFAGAPERRLAEGGRGISRSLIKPSFARNDACNRNSRITPLSNRRLITRRAIEGDLLVALPLGLGAGALVRLEDDLPRANR